MATVMGCATGPSTPPQSWRGRARRSSARGARGGSAIAPAIQVGGPAQKVGGQRHRTLWLNVSGVHVDAPRVCRDEGHGDGGASSRTAVLVDRSPCGPPCGSDRRIAWSASGESVDSSDSDGMHAPRIVHVGSKHSRTGIAGMETAADSGSPVSIPRHPTRGTTQWNPCTSRPCFT
jgi:hypothetical protein